MSLENVLDLFISFRALAVVTERDLIVWIFSALLVMGIGWSRYAKWRAHEKLVRELAAMEPEVRNKMLSRLSPNAAANLRQDLFRRFRIMC